MVGDRDRGDADVGTARRASSTRMTPLSMNGPPHCSRSQRDVVPASAAASPSTRRRRRRTPGRPPGRHFGDRRARAGARSCAQRYSQRGRRSTSGASRAIVRRSSCSGMDGLPQSRPCENVQSSVRMRPAAPAARARSTRALDRVARAGPVHLEERLRVGGDDLLDPACWRSRRQPDAPCRARRRRGRRRPPPSGCTACTPSGEITTGSATSTAHDGRRQVPLVRAARRRAGRSRAPRTPRGCRRASARARSRPGSPRNTDFGQRALRPPLRPPRRVSNHSRPSDRATRRRLRRGDHRDRHQRTAVRAPSASDPPSASAARRDTAASAASPWPSTHSGSGPSSGSPVKNFAAMQPPRHASYMPAARARAARLRLAQLQEQVRRPPHVGEAAGGAHVAGQERVVDRERAGVDVADRIDQAHDAARAAQVQARAASGRTRRGGRTSRRSARPRRGRAASRTATRCWACVGCSSSQTSAPRPDGRSRVSRSCAP